MPFFREEALKRFVLSILRARVDESAVTPAAEIVRRFESLAGVPGPLVSDVEAVLELLKGYGYVQDAYVRDRRTGEPRPIGWMLTLRGFEDRDDQIDQRVRSLEQRIARDVEPDLR